MTIAGLLGLLAVFMLITARLAVVAIRVWVAPRLTWSITWIVIFILSIAVFIANRLAGITILVAQQIFG